VPTQGRMSALSVLSAGTDFGAGDPKQDAAIAQRRALEAERLKRVKDPKLRTMGIDAEALASQVMEKEDMDAAEKALSMAYDKQRLLQDEQLAYLEQERLRAEKNKSAAIDDFRATMQGKEMSREYDLNDPKGKLNDLPGRVGDADARLSVSGMQQFHGEDLSHSSRIKRQQAELKAWCDETLRLKGEAKAKEKAADDAYASRAVEIDNYKTHLENTARQARTGTQVSLAEYQLAQAAAKRERERAQAVSELQDNIEEIQNNLGSDMLTENPAVGRSFIAANRVRADHYKGMSPAEQEGVLMEQAAQRAQAAERGARGKAEDAAVDAQMESIRKLGLYNDAQVAAMRAQLRKQVMEENQGLAASQYASKSYLDTKVFKNEIEASFFDQFNTTSR